MNLRAVFTISVLMAITVNAANYYTRGKVSNQSGEPVANAIVKFVDLPEADTTDENGEYSLFVGMPAVLPSLKHETANIMFNRGVLEFNLQKPSPVEYKVFDVRGKLLKKVSFKNKGAGIHKVNVAEMKFGSSLLLIQASSGSNAATFCYLPLYANKYLSRSAVDGVASRTVISSDVKVVLDSVMVTAEGYEDTTMAIFSYDTLLNITLKKENACKGCGNANPPRSGEYKITVDGKERKYILDVPENYDPERAYKLIFCLHWMNGRMEDVVNGGSSNGPYYGLKKQANGSAIFVSPEGSNNGWPNAGGEDIQFIRAMLEHFNSTMCIDQERIFSTGFSYGGMMSFAIGCAMADVFRAIAPMSGADYSGCNDTKNDPIAVWMAHGTGDNVVPLANGKSALSHFIEKNGCSNETVPVDPSPCVAYQNCKDGYPVIYCEFNGGHSTQGFAAQATWNFFNQF